MQEVQYIRGEVQGTPEQLERVEYAHKHAFWPRLSLKQKRFCEAYIILNDGVKAVNAAYIVKDAKSASTMAGTLMREQKVRAVLNLTGNAAEGLPITRKELGQLLSNRLRSDKTPSTIFVKMAQIYIGLNKWDVVVPKVKDEPEEEDVKEVDDINVQVRAVEAQRRNNGKQS